MMPPGIPPGFRRRLCRWLIESAFYAQSAYAKRMDALQADLKTVSESLKNRPVGLNDELKGRLDSARGNLSVLTRDKSRGAHNFEYAMKRMDQAAKDLEAVQAAVK